MTLTRREKRILLEACEGLSSPYSYYHTSCGAILKLCASSADLYLIEKYCSFYNKKNGKYWIHSSKFYEEMNDEYLLPEWRQTLLLFFREAHRSVE